MKTFLWHVEWITAHTHHPSEKFGLPLHSPHSKMLSINQRRHKLEFAGFEEVDVKSNTSSRTATVSLLKTHFSGHKLSHTTWNKYKQVYDIFKKWQDSWPSRPSKNLSIASSIPAASGLKKMLFIFWAWRRISHLGLLFDRRLRCIQHSGITMSSSKSCDGVWGIYKYILVYARHILVYTRIYK